MVDVWPAYASKMEKVSVWKTPEAVDGSEFIPFPIPKHHCLDGVFETLVNTGIDTRPSTEFQGWKFGKLKINGMVTLPETNSSQEDRLPTTVFQERNC